jgi:1-deoxyxylulose-5-phosphate synthase
MQYRNLGRSGVKVSPLCIGTMTWGDSTDQEAAIQIVDEALDAGINFFDTADTYHGGKSEEILGAALAREGKRDQVVLATKFTGPFGTGPNSRGSSRYRMMRQCESSLRRLKTDRIDLYQVHLMDLSTPLEEILLGLDVLVRQGKILHIGTSKFASALIAEGVALSRQHGWTQCVTEQPPYNLLDRGVERELVFACLRYGIGLIPWAPLATGLLSGKYHRGEPPPEGSRFEGKTTGKAAGRYNDAALERVEELQKFANEKGISLPDLSLAWLRHQPAVTAPILGIRAIHHLRSAIDGLEIKLTAEDLDRIDEIAPPGSSVSHYWDQVTFQQIIRPHNLAHRQM